MTNNYFQFCILIVVCSLTNVEELFVNSFVGRPFDILESTALLPAAVLRLLRLVRIADVGHTQ